MFGVLGVPRRFAARHPQHCFVIIRSNQEIKV